MKAWRERRKEGGVKEKMGFSRRDKGWKMTVEGKHKAKDDSCS